jgi:hypothetical protein
MGEFATFRVSGAMGDSRASVVTGETRSTRPPSEKRGGRRRGTAVELFILFQAMARLMCDLDMSEETGAAAAAPRGRRQPARADVAQSISMATLFAERGSSGGRYGHMVEDAATIAHAMPEVAAALAVARAAAEPAAAAVPEAVEAPAPVEPAPSAASERNSTVEAARARVRGPTLTEQRLRAAADAEKADAARREEQRRKRQEKKSGVGDGGAESAASDAGDECGQRRGRARLNASLWRKATARQQAAS